MNNMSRRLQTHAKLQWKEARVAKFKGDIKVGGFTKYLIDKSFEIRGKKYRQFKNSYSIENIYRTGIRMWNQNLTKNMKFVKVNMKYTF